MTSVPPAPEQGERTRICECCERSQELGEDGWVISREGDDFCPECAKSLAGELQRMIAALPQRIALCPQCAPEFYYPLKDGESLTCPTMGCGLDMVVYERGQPDYRVMWEEAARHALAWRARFERLSDAVDEYNAWEPGRRGYAAARRELLRVWLSVDDPDVGER